jgi:prepilin-type processing-associated H-X9-DG protein
MDIWRLRASGFGRVDALFTLGGVFLLLLLIWCGITVTGESRRIWVCAHHMKVLGAAFDSYARDHNDALPTAVFDDGTNTTCWDKEIAPYLMGSGARGMTGATSTSMDKVAYLFKCPSDKEPRGGALPRSYSMPIYDLNKVDWPPMGDSLGGLGLYVDSKGLKKVQKEKAGSENEIPALKRSMIPAPEDTSLLVERVSILNALWQTKYASIISAKEQFDAKLTDSDHFHRGKMNYLMLDGHIELLSRAQSAGFTGDGGLWTIWRED